MQPAKIHSLPDAETLAYTVDEAVRVTRIGRSVLYKLIKAGDLPIVKLGARTLIRRQALEALLCARERGAA